MATTNDLIQDVYANFLSAYAHNTGSASTVIAFEAVGLSPGLDPSATDSKAAALEYISGEADWVPDLANGSYGRTMRTISGTYTNLLGTSTPLSEQGAAIFNALKADAMESIHNFDLGSGNGPTTFKPAYTAPQNWFDPTQAGNWSSYAYTAAQPAAAPPTTHPPVRPPIWRMMTTAAPLLYTAAAAAGPPAAAQLNHPRATLLSPGAANLRTPASMETLAVVQDVNTPLAPRTLVNTAQLDRRIVISSEDLHLNRIIINNSGEQPVLQPAFSMSFQYTIVQLNRPWYSGDMLANDQWYVPGQHAGDFATGPDAGQMVADAGGSSIPATAAAANAGFFAWVPVAFIAIKDLVIRATDGSLDAATAKSVTSFGPFSIAPGASTDALTNPGIEIIAWICSAQPRLPPQTDPALAPPPTSQSDTIATDVEHAIDIFGGLLGKTR